MSVPAAYLGVIIIWSTTPLAIKWSGEGPGFLFGVSARMFVGTIICIAILWAMKTSLPRDRKSIQTYLAASLGIYGAMLSVYWGAQFIPSGLISVVFGLTPLITAVLSACLLTESRIHPNQYAGIILSIIGLVVIFQTDFLLESNAILGIGAIMFATLLHSSSMVWIKRIGSDLPAMTVNTGGLLLALFMYFITWFFLSGEWPQEIPSRAGVSILYLGIFGTALGFSLFFYSLKNLSTHHMSLIPLITPVCALLLGQFLNDEPIGSLVWMGTAFIGIGLILHQWGNMLGRWLQKVPA